MAAVTAFPNLNFALLENLSGFDVLQKGTITLFMMLLDFANHAELGRQSLEALFFCGLGEVIVHIGPLVVFAISCSCEVCCGVTDAAELLEPQFCVFLFIIGGLQEQGGNLLHTFLLSYGSEVGVLVASLGLASKCCLKVFFGLGTCILVLAHFGLLSRDDC